MMNLIYLGDAMCSWCWGFSPVLDRIRDAYGDRFAFKLVLGGLRPGAQAEPMGEGLKHFLRSEWSQIADTTGQPFDLRFLDREGFVYDTHPAARAVETMRRLKPGAEFEFFKRVQRAFYAENVNVTEPASYGRLVEPFDVDTKAFAEGMASDASDAAARASYQEARRLGIQGFPSIVIEDGERRGLLTYGYRPYDELVPGLEYVLAHGVPAAA
jgi:putative protein-disulfide isomerase